MTSFKCIKPNEQLSSVSYTSLSVRHGVEEVCAGFNQNHQLVTYEANGQLICQNEYDDQSRLVSHVQKKFKVTHVYRLAKGPDRTVINKGQMTIVYDYEYDAYHREIVRRASDGSIRYTGYIGQYKLVSLCNEWGVWRYRLETQTGQLLKMTYQK